MSHSFRASDVSVLGRFVTAVQQNINGHPHAHIINAITCADMNAHLGNAFTDRFTVAKVSEGGAIQPRQDSGIRFDIGER
jgi:hypothetical protein